MRKIILIVMASTFVLLGCTEKENIQTSKKTEDTVKPRGKIVDSNGEVIATVGIDGTPSEKKGEKLRITLEDDLPPTDFINSDGYVVLQMNSVTKGLYDEYNKTLNENVLKKCSQVQIGMFFAAAYIEGKEKVVNTLYSEGTFTKSEEISNYFGGINQAEFIQDTDQEGHLTYKTTIPTSTSKPTNTIKMIKIQNGIWKIDDDFMKEI